MTKVGFQRNPDGTVVCPLCKHTISPWRLKMCEESSVTERVVIVTQLEEMAGVVEHLDQMPIRLALDTLDQVIMDCEGVLTMLNDLKVWANQPTKGVNIPF